MDRHLFRGKRLDDSEYNGEWVKGSLHIYRNGDMAIIDCAMPLEKGTEKQYAGIYYEIDPTTVGQCTGLKDKNGTLVFEGDVVINTAKPYKRLGAVYWCGLRFMLKGKTLSSITTQHLETCGIIGNIYENPEILETPQA